MQELIKAEADLELKDPKDNTPLLLASGCGVTDIREVLIGGGADVTATNYLGKSCWQKSDGPSSTTRKSVEAAGSTKTYVAASGQTRKGVSSQRQARYIMGGIEGLHANHGLRTNRHRGSQHCDQGPGHEWHRGNQDQSKRKREFR